MEKRIENPAPVVRCGAQEAVQFIRANILKTKLCRAGAQVLAAAFHEPPELAIAAEASTFEPGDRHDHVPQRDSDGPAPSTFDYRSLDSETAASVRTNPPSGSTLPGISRQRP